MDETENRPEGRFWINSIEVDSDGLQIHRDGHLFAIEPKVMQVLCELAARPGEVVGRQHMIETIWQVSYGGDESLTRAISILRKTLGEGEASRRLIETVPRRGYRLNAIVHTADPREEATAPAIAASMPPPQAAVEAVEATVRMEQAPRTRRLNFRFVTIGLGALILAGFLIVSLLQSRNQNMPSAVAQFDVSAETIATLETDAPGFQAGLASANRFWRVFSEEDTQARYRFALTADEAGEAGQYQFALQQSGITETLFTTDLSTRGLSGDVFAERVVLLASHLAKCGDDLISAMSLDRRTNPTLLGMLFELCYTNGGTFSQEPADQISAHMLEVFPDEPGVQALHAVLILSKPDQHWMGQRDIRQPEIQEEATRLLDLARDSESAHQIVEMGDTLLAAKQADLAEMEVLLSEIGASNWLGLGAVTMRNGMLRRAGRLTEAEYLLTTVTTAWPVFLELRGALSIVQAQKGDFEAADATIIEALRLAPDNMLLYSTFSLQESLYGDPDEARPTLDGAPPSIKDCLNSFLDVREGKKETIGTECDRLEVTQRARALAILGEYDRAFSLIELFAPEAQGVGMVLHYAEFLPLWKEDRMWEVARNFGLIEYWRESETRPDMCYLGDFLEICAEKI
ncbi:MAG: hypothetical protein CMK09_17490 [Ponticaulis sp.]|nr:hypothetical protein [Ponticaulis sp.]|tara:strand:+ start:44678 stop:46570 length:1893 start_codon:yes stop_codon:yes gene_type:complete